MNVLKDWTCNVTLEKGIKMTVGQPFVITCEGGTPVDTKEEILVFPDHEKTRFDVVALDKQFRNENQIFIKATSWATGNKSLADYTLVVGDQIIEIKGPKFQVTSVLESGTEMNMPPGASVEPFPTMAKAGVVVLLVFAFAAVVYWFRSNKKYDRALIKLHSLKTGLSPYHELHKQLRLLDQSISKNETPSSKDLVLWVDQLQNSVTNYLCLSVEEPLFLYNSKRKRSIVRKYFRKKKMSDEVFKAYISMMKEIKSLDQDVHEKSNISKTDILGTMDMAREFADQVTMAEARHA